MSSIKIRNMEMPERCRDCILFSAKLRYGCRLGAGQGSDPTTIYRQRHADCPLEALPDEEGRPLKDCQW